MPNLSRYDLMMVMPVYNEEGCIKQVVQSWHEQFTVLNINFKIIALNDGSKDGTAKELEFFQNNDRIKIVNKANSGHGPTILMGYHEAVKEAQWVFQCDSDNEMPPESFCLFWHKRQSYDALLGIRQGRSQSLPRKLVSAISRFTVSGLSGKGVHDVNVPYRLMRSDVLIRIIDQIPDNTFAPNVIVSAGLAKMNARIWQVAVPHHNRTTGEFSLKLGKLFKASFRAFLQTWQCVANMKF